MIRLDIPVIVEGKYDKARLSGVVDATIIATDGFAVFNNEEKLSLIRALGRRGVVIMSDSDGGGRLIRSHLRGMLDGIDVYDLYIPEVVGRERRKTHASAAGLLGVEGIDSDVLRGIFTAFADAHPELCGNADAPARHPIGKSTLYELGLTGTPSAAENRAAVCAAIGLPRGMTANAFARAVEILMTEDELKSTVNRIFAKQHSSG